MENVSILKKYLALEAPVYFSYLHKIPQQQPTPEMCTEPSKCVETSDGRFHDRSIDSATPSSFCKVSTLAGVLIIW